MRRISNPFWRGLPVFHVFKSFPPDLLHQIHKGVFNEHLVEWCRFVLGDKEVDARFKCIPRHSTLRHFSKGISKVSQWTGRECKEMEKVLVPIVAGARTEVTVCARAFLDFIYYASFTQHSTESIDMLERSLRVFHDNKDIFEILGPRKHFNFPKLHALMHYVEHIKRWGSLDQYNTETAERLHIIFAKELYRRTNRKDFIAQQVELMNRQESLYFWTNFLAWVKGRSLVEAEESDCEDDESDVDELPDFGVDVEDKVGSKEQDDLIRISCVCSITSLTTMMLT
ncbi:hypothetical protein SISSUDRAFT_980350 [Sistotremastrum suecicum HHB10207 ss-3]|uniref:Uncharacterized protein n=1 Tax=Sistotremastrum suecicum HHB10207 ss-3 TaxID=1314776 RepID=A0A166H4R1_9AGAM|nr:hypothetical protein SISSUDRAFT_980350 [Sistotremastrum suecicum HHB10207 ss-3]